MKTLIQNTTLAALAMALGLCAFSTRAQAQGKETIAVGTIQVTRALEEDMMRKGKNIEMRRVMEAMDHHLLSTLIQTRKFSVVGRSDLQDLQKEQELGGSGMVSTNTAAEKGKVAGAKYRLTVTVDSFLEQNENAVFATGNQMTKRRFQISAQSIIYDATTGVALDSANIAVQKIDVLSLVEGQSSDGKRTDEMMPALARELAEKVVHRTVNFIYPVKIIKISGNVVTINRGDGGGIKMDEIWDVFGPTEIIKDPDTGEELKTKGSLIGQVRITSVEPAYSKGEIINDKGVVVLSVLSKAPDAAEPTMPPPPTQMPPPAPPGQ